MKKLFALFLSVTLLLGLVSGCSSNEPKSTKQEGTQTQTQPDSNSDNKSGSPEKADPDNPWDSFDTSQEVHISMYVLGSEPNDMDRVVDLVNERMKKLINTTIEINIIPLADYSTKYPLLLAGGEDVDLVFSAPWLFFAEQADRGAFLELTEEFRNKWMPSTMKSQTPVSWKQALYKGKNYTVPRNESDYDNSYGVLVRKDIREKYGIPEIKSLADYENFLLAVADNEKSSGMFALYAFPSLPIEGFLGTAPINWMSVSNGVYWDADNSEFKSEDLIYRYTSKEYLDYCLMTAKWAEAGVWPSNAITGTTHTNDLFLEGKSASNLGHYKTANSQIIQMKEKGIDVEFFNILPDSCNTKISAYNNDAIAITSFSKNPERAALCLDVMKNDKAINVLLQGGVEGEHYILNEADNTYLPGPKAADYPYGGWAWALRSKLHPTVGGILDQVKAVREKFVSINIDPERFPIDGFTFDDSGLSAEVAVITSVVNEYKFSFDLGVFGKDTEAKYNEFVGKLKAAGCDKVFAAVKEQVKAYTGQ